MHVHERKTDIHYVEKIIEDIDFVLNHTEGLTKEELEKDEVLLDSVMFRIIKISENADRLSEDFKAKNNSIPWREMKGMRNRIVHEYGSVKISVLYDTIVISLPALIDCLKNLI